MKNDTEPSLQVTNACINRGIITNIARCCMDID